jgi:hypothetical protein
MAIHTYKVMKSVTTSTEFTVAGEEMTPDEAQVAALTNGTGATKIRETFQNQNVNCNEIQAPG